MEYFYGQESELFVFYRIPKALITDKRFKDNSIKSIMGDLGCAHNKAEKLLAELEHFDLLRRKRQGLGKPDLLYLLKFENRISGLSIFKNQER